MPDGEPIEHPIVIGPTIAKAQNRVEARNFDTGNCWNTTTWRTTSAA
jgi:preprotein translocase subunit SecA